MENEKIPFMDLAWQAAKVKSAVWSKWQQIVEDADFILGPHVTNFETEFAEFSGVSSVIGVANGTDALELAIRALGLGAGDEILVPANSFIASALAVSRAGATPVFVDCEDGNYLIDITKASEMLTPNTRAIMPVHLYGQMADMRKVTDFAVEHGLFVLEDVAQAQGASQGEFRAGGSGNVSATSFYPGKNLGAFGDAGACMTNSPELGEKVRALRNYGSERKYHHPMVGFNSRLDSLQAIVLSEKLKFLTNWNQLRQDQANRYLDLLKDVPGIVLPKVLKDNVHVWHLFVIQHPDRDGLIRHLSECGIGTGIHYPDPIHLQGAFQELGYVKGDFPVAENTSSRLVSLPIFPGLSEAQQDRVVQAIVSFEK